MHRIRSTRVSLVALTLLMTAGAILGPVQDANAATVMYGRAEYQEYFSGGYANRAAYSCGGGQLICGGISETATNGLVNFYRDHLNDTGNEQNRVAAAFTVLAMLGVDGPAAGGNITNGVNMARTRFSEWEARVRSYGNAGRINFNQNFSFSTNTAYRSQDVLWHNVTDTAPAIVFSLANGTHVAIKRSCANLVGAAYLPPADYGLSAVSRVDRTQATPGERITWEHVLRNDGTGTTTQDTSSSLGMSGFSNGVWVSGVAAATIGAGAGVDVIRSSWGYNIYDVTQADVGNTLCEWVQFDPVNSSGVRNGTSSAACVAIPYNYTLVPEITNITNGNMIESGAGVVPVQGRVTNTGPTKSVPNIQWQVTQIRYAPGAATPNSGGGSSGGAPCAYFSGNTGCTPVGSGTEGAGYGFPQTIAYPTAGSLGDETVGTRLCYAMSVNPGSTATGNWRHSQLYCYVVGKKPKLQIYGGDLIVGRGYNAAGTKISANVITSSSNKSGTYYGSWGEYAIIPSGTVRGMASASGYAVGIANNNLCNSTNPLNLLSFSNARTPAPPSVAPPTCDDTAIGRYSLTSASQLDAIATRFAVTTGARNLTGGINIMDSNPALALSSKTIYPGSGTINLSSSADIPVGKWVVINAPNADVRITSNIKYTGATLTGLSDIPQVVIIARNIVIADNVDTVDAWLFAKGTGADGIVNTCDSGISEPTGLTSNVCNTQLTINGPVIANHLLLHRTHGSGVGSDSGVPAEIFNLRPDAYMWASSFSGVGTKARTVMTTELPPRF